MAVSRSQRAVHRGTRGRVCRQVRSIPEPQLKQDLKQRGTRLRTGLGNGRVDTHTSLFYPEFWIPIGLQITGLY